MQLSPSFTLEEFTFSETATRLGIDNTPPAEVVSRLVNTAHKLEIIRFRLGHPITIPSGYRSPELNRKIGGSKNSAHCTGDAVDFVCRGFGDPYRVALAVMDTDVKYDQLIHEFGKWTHISFAARLRMMPMTIFGNKKGYVPGIKTKGEYDDGA